MATTPRKRRTPRRKTTTGLSVGKVVKGVQTPFTILIGMLGGSYLNKFLQKTLNPIVAEGDEGTAEGDEGTAGLAGKAVEYGIPVSLLLVGVILPNFVKFGPAGKYSKDLGTGIAVYGGFQAAKQLIGADMLEGLKGAGKMGVLPRNPIIRQLPANALRTTKSPAVI